MALKRRYVPDLKQMAATCEGNYLRIIKLLSDNEEGATETFIIQGEGHHQAEVSLTVTESFRYTSTVEVRQQGLCPEWIQPPCMLVRLYHDARSAEVISYQNQKGIHGRYQYPNPKMRMPDEKSQLNQFLSEWLTYCLKHGYAAVAPDFAPDR